MKTELTELVRVFVKGGILSPRDFLKIINLAERHGATHFNFGSRQDLLLPVLSKTGLQEAFDAIDTPFETNGFNHQNIASSYVALDVMPCRKWVTSDRYLYILNQFDWKPKLRINIVDPVQSLVPLFTGHINFVASGQENYWYLCLRFDHVQKKPWNAPILVYTDDVALVAKAIEDLSPLEMEAEGFFSKMSQLLNYDLPFNKQTVMEELKLPNPSFPYYEGINRLPDSKYWLGLYWRNNNFSIPIMRAICERCIETDIGKISLTPWKSFVIKGITENDRLGWEKLMGKLGMNLRHSALELNWHLPALDTEAYELKHFLIDELDKQDISTYGLTFTVKTSEDITLFTSVVIEKNEPAGSEETFNILYSKDFNPNTMEYFTYVSSVSREVLPPLLIELTQIFYDGLTKEQGTIVEDKTLKNSEDRIMFQCQECLTIYDEKLGDASAGIAPNTPFSKLPASYQCPLCMAGKSSFKLML